ncbi:MAG: universal stress protein [Planctomycetaceae bacterium]
MIRLERILVPVDFSEFGDCAIRYGCEFARKFSSETHFLHVVEDAYPMVPEAGMLLPSQTDYIQELKASAERGLTKIPDNKHCEGLSSIVRHVSVGAPFLEIIRYARQHQIDLIVIGTHGRTGLSHMLMGSVAERIVRKAHCPVLTIRPEGHSFVMP